MNPPKLTHFDAQGRARMVDVSEKPDTLREAVARGRVTLRPETLRMILDHRIAKGNVMGVARIAGILGAKQTPFLIPMCHPLPLTNVEVDLSPIQSEESPEGGEHRGNEASRIDIEARVRVTGKTGVEMEALTAVTLAALTIYDMCKAVDRDMSIGDIRLMEKRGGKSGTYRRKE